MRKMRLALYTRDLTISSRSHHPPLSRVNRVTPLSVKFKKIKCYNVKNLRTLGAGQIFPLIFYFITSFNNVNTTFECKLLNIIFGQGNSWTQRVVLINQYFHPVKQSMSMNLENQISEYCWKSLSAWFCGSMFQNWPRFKFYKSYDNMR